MSNAGIVDRGITCLLSELGAVDTARFVSIIKRGGFDYTKWQRERFDNVSLDDYYETAMDYNKTNPFVHGE